AVFAARERHAEVLELDDRRHCIFAHVFDRILVAKPVRALDSVIHVPAPIVLAHIAECRTNAALCRYRMAAGREHLRYAGGPEPGGGGAEGGTQSGTAATDHDDIIGVVVDRISLAHGQPAFVFPESGGRRSIDTIGNWRRLASHNPKVVAADA